MMALLTLITIYFYILADAPIKNIIIKETPLIDIPLEENRSLDYLNRIRVNSGLVPFKLNHKLKKASQNHAKYLIENHIIGHYEDSKKIGYTGKYASERVIHSGYKTSMIIENISNNNLNYKESIDGLMSAIYHRFGFLDFHTDEIGIGIWQNRDNRLESAFVYDMGSSNLEAICQDKNSITSGEYADGICANRDLKIRASLFNRVLNKNRLRNSKIVIYPYKNQTDIPPAFYEELPDPLPNYSVSGFPISISFNESYFKRVRILSFKLFDSQKKELKDVIIYDNKTDPNRRLKKFEFALFPLNRLLWGENYTVEVKYIADGRLNSMVWRFKTREFKIPIYRVTDKRNSFNIKVGESSIFYFPPSSKRDILDTIKYPASLDISFIDKNTIKLVANSSRYNKLILKVGNHKLNLTIRDKRVNN